MVIERCIRALALMTVLVGAADASAQELEPGAAVVRPVVQVVDGSTLVLDGGLTVRLQGVKPPDAVCQGADRKLHDCGGMARAMLETFARDRVLVCTLASGDQHEAVGRCSREQDGRVEDVGQIMVLLGAAFADGPDYIRDQAQAQDMRVGFWSGEFRPLVGGLPI